mmetsp:Transcript_55164/g.128732  ORF Transcript_55164/g.128732 Transcript_55164/m.128732 type:complete len:210 (+) Transcript_55164:652-1281(+)
MLKIIYMSMSNARISSMPGRFKNQVAVRMARSNETVKWVDIHCSNLSSETLTTPITSTERLVWYRHISSASAGSQLASRETMRVLSLSVGQARYTCWRQTTGVLGSERVRLSASLEFPKIRLESGSRPHSAGCLTMESPGATCSSISMVPVNCVGFSYAALVSGRTSQIPASPRPWTWIPLRANFTKCPPQGHWQCVKLDCPVRAATCQ